MGAVLAWKVWSWKNQGSSSWPIATLWRCSPPVNWKSSHLSCHSPQASRCSAEARPEMVKPHPWSCVQSDTKSWPASFHDAQPQWLPDNKTIPLLCSPYLGVCQSTMAWHDIGRRCPGDGTHPSSCCPANLASSLAHTEVWPPCAT